MPIETTATVLVAQTHPFFEGTIFNAQHLLVLNEGFRACWQVVPMDPEAARISLGSANGRPSWTVCVPQEPNRLLMHGLLAYLLAVSPVIFAEQSTLAAMVRSNRRREAPITTVIAGREDLSNIVAALPTGLELVVTTLSSGSSIRQEEVAELVAMGVAVVRAWTESDLSEPRSGCCHPGIGISQDPHQRNRRDLTARHRSTM